MTSFPCAGWIRHSRRKRNQKPYTSRPFVIQPEGGQPIRCRTIQELAAIPLPPPAPERRHTHGSLQRAVRAFDALLEDEA